MHVKNQPIVCDDGTEEEKEDATGELLLSVHLIQRPPLTEWPSNVVLLIVKEP